jgi:hypothetical protein
MKIAKLASLLLAIPVLSSAATDYLREGELFMKARAQLLRDKWKPIPMHMSMEFADADVAPELIKRKIIEVESCSMDTSSCTLFYKKNGKCLRLDTEGAAMKIMKVVAWSNECPKQ